ncbi:MAG TPA: mechanosensitive ion channel protein MscS [Clostridiales bacterium]|nr:mechanosensitive ion channel protein MscS [Clostridiales bacterium]
MPFFDSDTITKISSQALVALLILVIGIVAIKISIKIFSRFLRKTRIDPMFHRFFGNILKVALWSILLITLLDSMGIKATSFLTAFAAAGVAVAMALKDSLGNFAGGILIMFTKPFTKGNFVECCGVSGMIESIDLLYTTILTIDNQVVTVPNGQLTNSTITNYSKLETRRLTLNISIAYEADIETAKKALLDMLAKDNRILPDPPPYCVVDDYGDSSVNLILRCWCKTSEFWDVRWDNMNKVKDTLKDAGVTIPFPQLDIEIKNERRM